MPLICFNSHLKQTHISNTTWRFGFNGGCGVHGSTCIEVFKELVLATDKWLWIISMKVLKDGAALYIS